MKDSKLIKCQWKCPKCGSEDADVISREGDEEKGIFELALWCDGCGCQYNEVYTLVYKGSYIGLDI